MIEKLSDGGMVITGEDVELYACLATKARLHMELNKMFDPEMGRLLRQRAIIKAKRREEAYREFCAVKGLDPTCNRPGHDHGKQKTMRVKTEVGGRLQWVVVRGE